MALQKFYLTSCFTYFTLSYMYKVNKEILQTPVEEGSVLLLEPKTGMYFEMNETAVFVYQAIESGLSFVNRFVIKKYGVCCHQVSDIADKH